MRKNTFLASKSPSTMAEHTKWRLLLWQLCTPGCLDRIQQWNLSAPTIKPVSPSIEICQCTTARTVSQKLRGNLDFLCEKAKMARSTPNFMRYFHAQRLGTATSTMKQPLSDPCLINRILQPQ